MKVQVTVKVVLVRHTGESSDQLKSTKNGPNEIITRVYCWVLHDKKLWKACAELFPEKFKNGSVLPKLPAKYAKHNGTMNIIFS